jgi:anti-sigma regulatory factor (Ser/Thr protein kinase)
MAPRRQQPKMALDVRFDGPGLTLLRFTVAAHAAELAPEDTAEEVVLVAHELATNAIRHGGGRGRLRLWRAHGHVCCQVIDGGPGLVDPSAGTRPPTPSTPGGRGLWITRQLSELTIETSSTGTTVTATLPKD